MEKFEHKYIEVNGLKLHVAEIGSGSKVIMFLHGFPEIWYSWRYQMTAVAKAGFRAIAPDFRGYGLSDVPPQPEKTTFADLVSDLVGLLDALNISKVFLMAKNFGVLVASMFLILHRQRVSGFATVGAPFWPPQPPMFNKYFPEGFYMSRWQEPGRAEADFGRFDVKTVVKNIYILFSKSEIPIANENQEIMDLVEPSTPLPSWLTDDDLAIYAESYEKSGFRTPLQVPYRAIDDQQDIPDGANLKFEVPALLIMGEKDLFLKFPGIVDYVRGGKVKDFLPHLEIKYLPEGTQVVQEQFPNEVNQLVLNFLTRHS